MDIIDLITQDHREVEGLFEDFREGRGDRSEIAQKIISELSRHAAVEEQVLYPVAKSALPDGEGIVEHSLEEHQEAEELMAEMEQGGLDDDALGERMAKLESDVQDHVQDEEEDLLPKVREHVDAERREKMGALFEQAKKMAPTHPHPHAPNTPPGNLAAGPMAGVADKVRDLVSSMGSS